MIEPSNGSAETPDKGILIDFKGVKSVCNEFAFHLSTYYQHVRDKGLQVRFVNVDPDIEPYIRRANISVVLDVHPDRAVLHTKSFLKICPTTYLMKS